MKILLVNKLYYPWIGGVETVTKDIAEGLQSVGFKTEVLACVPKGDSKEEIAGGVPVHKASSIGIYLGMPISFDFFLKFKNYIQSTDILFIQHPFPLATIAHLLFAREKPTVIWYHADIERQKIANFFFAPFLTMSLRRAKKIFVASRNTMQHSRYLKPFHEKCSIIPFGIDAARFKDSPEVLSAAELIKKQFGESIVLSVGRLVPYKGYEYLIKAMKNVPANLLIVGSGGLRSELESIAKREGLSKKVFFIDSVSDPIPYYFACDLFVLPSIYKTEAFGVVQLEAMACGRAVINTSLPTGVPEVSIGGETGYTVPPRDVGALREAIAAIIGDSSLRGKFGAAARKRALGVFSKENFIDSLRKELASIEPY